MTCPLLRLMTFSPFVFRRCLNLWGWSAGFRCLQLAGRAGCVTHEVSVTVEPVP